MKVNLNQRENHSFPWRDEAPKEAWREEAPPPAAWREEAPPPAAWREEPRPPAVPPPVWHAEAPQEWREEHHLQKRKAAQLTETTETATATTENAERAHWDAAIPGYEHHGADIVDLEAEQPQQAAKNHQSPFLLEGLDGEPDVVIATYGREKPNCEYHEAHLMSYTCCEMDRFKGGDRDGKNWKHAHLLDSKSVNRCCGENGRILLLTALHEKTPLYFRHVKKVLRDNQYARGGRKKPYVHGLRCKSGRHRAMAEGVLVSHAMNAAGIRTHLYHLDTNDESDRPPCGCPDRCQFTPTSVLNQYAADREAALMVAQQLWQGIQL